MIQEHDPREFVHRIDRDGRIRFVNDAWLSFAAENRWGESAREVLGSPLMAHISDAQTRHIYDLLLERVHEKGRDIRFHYRCDSPDCRRFMEMWIHHDRALDQIVFRSRVLRLETREPVALLDSGLAERSGDVLMVCSWCKAVEAGHVWVEVEQAVERLDLFAPEALPPISHGICPDCSERMTRGRACA
jgi:hypothetical protein